MRVKPYPFRARAWWGEALVGESDACLLVERDGEPALLYFPRADIDLSAFRSAGPVSPEPEEGMAEAWDDGSPGDAVVTIVTDPPAAFASLRDRGRFDAARARVEVLDDVAGTGRDISIKRFPTWGDADDLVGLLDVERDGDLAFVAGAHTDGRRPVVEGSQMLGQAIVAAGRHAPGRRVVSASMLFLRAADAGRPLRFELSELTAGRTFTGLAAEVLQGGRRCAAGTLLLDVTAPAVVSHAVDAPDVPGPYECPPYDMGVTGRDLRVVDGAYGDDAGAPVGPPVIDCWVRFRTLPDDPPLHAGLMAQFAGHVPIATALRPHAGVGQSAAHRTLSMGINAINLSVHRDVRADEWMLYHHHSTFAGDGMTHAECRVFTEGGELLASFSVDAMVRPFAEADRAQDYRTAM
ncbi:MAG TPA: acyl-CoA thioesterase domain-containing protein [Acidimicrobiales bacterium]|nr:acyl-CoA thioesterase domain-containing protein [Acidimicrobiales bacterium]